ncbi:MAG: MauE/DoxX family redox-associated membrane protein [Planctomycetota bacterium]
MKLGKQNRQKLLRAFLFVVRVALGCLFIYSSLPKIRQPYDFLSNVYEYEIVGPKLGLLVAMMLPWLELLAGICLVGGIFVSGALLVSAGMAAMFTFVIASALYRGLQISCGCFGAHDEVINYSTLVRACLILLFSAAAYIGTIAFTPSPGITESSEAIAIPEAQYEVS